VGSKLEQLLERPSRPFTPRAGPPWPARILQAGEFYHVKEQLVYCGLDIAKWYLDAAIWKREASLDQRWKWSSGVYQVDQATRRASAGDLRTQRRLRAAVHPGALSCPDQSQFGASQSGTRAFARAAGILAKTDTIDARVLCVFGEAMQPQMVTASKLEQDK